MDRDKTNERLQQQLTEARKRIAELERLIKVSGLDTEEKSQNIKTILQALLNSSLRAIYLVDTSGTLLAMNDKGASRFKSKVSKMLGHCLYDFMPSDVAQSRRAHVEELIRTGKPIRFGDHREGIWLDNTLYPVPNASGQTTKILIHADDITERKSVEEALRRSERRYRTYVDLTSQFAWVTDSGGQIVEDVPALRRFTGQTYEEVKGSGWSNAVHPDDLQVTLAVWSQAVSTRTAYEMEYRMRRYDGEYRIVLDKSVPILSDDGQVLEWVGTCIDITERRRVEEKLRESERRFRAIADYTYDLEHWFDPNGKLLWVNPAVFQFTGYTVDECMAMTDYPLPLIDRRDRKKMIDSFAEALQGVSRNDVEFRVWSKDGTLKWASASWQPIYDVDGSSLGHRSSIRDITDRKRVEEKVKALNEELHRRVMELKTTNKNRSLMN